MGFDHLAAVVSRLGDVPFEFVIFGLTLAGVAMFHHRTLLVAVSGLATLVEALQNSRKSQITLFLCALTPRVRSILEIARLNSVFTIHESRDAALAG